MSSTVEADPIGMRGAGAELGGMLPNVVLEHLTVRDFRNLERIQLDLPAGGLAIVGENGHGKTNLLEAIYYLQLLRSMRGARDVDLVHFGSGGFHVAARVDGVAAREIAVGFDRQTKRKKVSLDGAEPPRLSDALGALPSVIFAPRDVELIAGAPSERRRFLDVTLAVTSRRYLGALQQYRAALLRRNAALREVARTGASPTRVAVWEPALAEHGAVLLAERVRWIARRAAEFSRLCTAIGERGEPRLRYVSSLGVGRHEGAHGAEAPSTAHAAAPDEGALRDAMLHALESHRTHDIRRVLTHTGPHRDDLDITVAGRSLRTFGSAGQQRTAAIALRLLEGDTLRERSGRAPVVLLDDPFAELDVRRSQRILELLAGAGFGQTILAVPRVSDIPAEMTSLERRTIRDGAIVERGSHG